MGVLLFRYLDLQRSNIEYRILNSQLPIENYRYEQGHLQGLIDIINLCDTLDFMKKQQDDKKERAEKEKAGTRYETQAEVLGSLRSEYDPNAKRSAE